MVHAYSTKEMRNTSYMTPQTILIYWRQTGYHLSTPQQGSDVLIWQLISFLLLDVEEGLDVSEEGHHVGVRQDVAGNTLRS